MTYIKHVEHLSMYEDYYSEMEMSASILAAKYKTLLRHMMSLLCACKQKMEEHAMALEEWTTMVEVNKITYQIPVYKTWAIYESLLVINTYLNDFLTHIQLRVFNGQVF